MQGGGRQRADLGGPQRAALPVGGPARRVHARPAPQAAPVLEPEHGAAGLVADGALAGHGEVALHPLVRHDDVAILVLDDVLADRGQRRPFAVADRLGRAPLVGLALADAAAQPVRGHARERVAAQVAVRGPGVRGGVPVVLPGQEVVLVAALEVVADGGAGPVGGRLERRHPLLHQAARLGGQRQAAAGADHLKCVRNVPHDQVRHGRVGQVNLVEYHSLIIFGVVQFGPLELEVAPAPATEGGRLLHQVALLRRGRHTHNLLVSHC